MNHEKIKSIISLYKSSIVENTKNEIYKWEAVQHFQNNWDINAADFHSMFKSSISKTVNLLKSKSAWADTMMLRFAEKNSELVRGLFNHLFDEEIDFIERRQHFLTEIEEIRKALTPEYDHHYHYDHEISVYLSLRFPEKYFIYKYGILNKIVRLIDYPYKPKVGIIENIIHYNIICNRINDFIKTDKALIKMHFNRLSEGSFIDPNFTILTQDILYCTVTYFFEASKCSFKSHPEEVEWNVTEVDASLIPKKIKIDLGGGVSKVNYIKKAIENKNLGDAGEDLVEIIEKRKLKEWNISKEIVKGLDGEGFDLKSYDIKGNEIFIEVKTTAGGLNREFFLTANELQLSKDKPNQFFLYRLYDFDKKKKTASLLKIKGDLSALCCNPVQFKVSFESR